MANKRAHESLYYIVDINLFKSALKEAGLSMRRACEITKHPNNYFYIRFEKYGYIRESTAKEIENALGIPPCIYGVEYEVPKTFVDENQLAKMMRVSSRRAKSIAEDARAAVMVPPSTPYSFVLYDTEKVKAYCERKLTRQGKTT